MKSPADVIRTFLIDEDLGSDGGTWPIYVAFLPDTPDDAIVVSDTAGMQDGRVMSGEQIIHPGIQVVVRGVDYVLTYSKISDIALALDGINGLSVALSSEDSYTLKNVSRTGDILPLGMDEVGDRRRFNFSVNAVITISQD